MAQIREDIMKMARQRREDFKRFQQEGLIPLDGDFFPSVHYPPITMYPPISEKDLFRTYTNPPDGLFDLYAHLPFCIQHCTFCHYPVKVGELEEEKDRYLDALEKEMDIYMRLLGLEKIKARSILVGGGTPTYLSPAQLERFLEFFTSRLDTSSLTQFTYDVDPPTLLGEEGAQRLKLMRDFGVSRLTIGLQSLDDEVLDKMNRPHTAKEAVESVEASRRAGFTNNIEFIFGYEGQSLENWTEMMERAVGLDTEEVQLYRLKVVPYGDFEGPVKRKYIQNTESFPSPEEAIMMKQIAISILNENGYSENLRRVFTKKRDDYSHYADNQCCKLRDEVGFGLTAFSSLRDRFALNTQNFKEYYDMVSRERLPVNRGLVRTRDDQLRWALVLPLKNREIYKSLYEMRTGASLDEVFRKKIEKLKRFGLLYENEKLLRLTELGAFFADEVCEQFHHPDYIPFPRENYARGQLYPYDDWQP
ncbi:MAG: radical SAM protein [Candidatus Omnitrophica bacterium]|nr:radical SAM protein [Candidatus Omnitrophota bacterium]